MLIAIIGYVFLIVLPLLAVYVGSRYTSSPPPSPIDASRDQQSYFKLRNRNFSQTPTERPTAASDAYFGTKEFERTSNTPGSDRTRHANFEQEAVQAKRSPSVCRQSSVSSTEHLPHKKPCEPPFSTAPAPNTAERCKGTASTFASSSSPKPHLQPKCLSPSSTTEGSSLYRRRNGKSLDDSAPYIRCATHANQSHSYGDCLRGEKSPHVGFTAKHYFFSFLKTLALILGVALFILGFAVLIAHCLALFIVYKTEARLGEIRTGVVRGGEMRVCLCARGH
jgi:hypothetical protein